MFSALLMITVGWGKRLLSEVVCRVMTPVVLSALYWFPLASTRVGPIVDLTEPSTLVVCDSVRVGSGVMSILVTSLFSPGEMVSGSIRTSPSGVSSSVVHRRRVEGRGGRVRKWV